MCIKNSHSSGAAELEKKTFNLTGQEEAFKLKGHGIRYIRVNESKSCIAQCNFMQWKWVWKYVNFDGGSFVTKC